MKYFFICCAAMLVALAGRAQQYSILLIPDSLLKKANAVKRWDEHKLTVYSAAKASHKYKLAYTIFNENADYLAMQQEVYDKFNEIESIDATLYDALGIKIKSLKTAEIKDLSGMGGGTEIMDNRIKQFGFFHKTYPYTVEFEVSLRMNGLMFLPTWYAIENELIAVQQSSMEITAAPEITILHKAYNYPGSPWRSTDAKGNVVMRWEIKNQVALNKEYAAPPWFELTPAVFFAMKDFEMGGYKGSNASWESFGSFVYQMTSNKDGLPAELKSRVQQLVQGKTSTAEKVAVLYRFMQENTRYISIQLGIGGWVPFDANFVYTKKYGDCKALTNYMHALLKEAGVPSIYTLVKAGRGTSRFIEDFPSSQFNHVILCVPNGNDSLWLECTSQTMPPGYLGDFTNNRPVLLVMEKGSKLIRTPHYSQHENLQQRVIYGKIGNDGLLTAEATTLYRAMQQDYVHMLMKSYSPEKQKDYLQQSLDIGTYSVKDFSYREQMDRLPEVHEQILFEAPHYAQVSGKRIMFIPNVMSKSGLRLTRDTARRFEIVFSYPYADIDSVIIDIGEGYEVESLPKPITIESIFGRYTAKAELMKNQLVYTRVFEQREGRFASSKYEELVSFFETIARADRAKVVMVKPAPAHP